MNEKLNNSWKQLAPKGVIYFLLLLFFFHFSWKITIDGDMDSEFIYFLDKNVTPEWFHSVCKWIADTAGWFIRLFPESQNLIIKDTTLYFPDGGITISIIWGCTGIKQMFIFAGIMIFYRCISLKKNHSSYSIQFNPYWNKLWYIPLGCIILTIYNIIRVSSIVMLTNGYPEKFESLHDGIFRYIYYTIIFLLWVIWEEVFVKKENKQ